MGAPFISPVGAKCSQTDFNESLETYQILPILTAQNLQKNTHSGKLSLG